MVSMNKKNVLVVTHYTYSHKGGILDGICKLSDELSKDGIETVFLFTKECKKLEFIKDFKNAYFLTNNPILDLRLIMKIIGKHNIGIIHSHLVFPKQIILLKMASHLSMGVVYIRHMHMLYKKSDNKLKNFAKRLLGTGQYNVACSEVCRDTLVEGKVRNIVTITNAIDFGSLNVIKKDEKLFDKKKIKILMFGYDYVNKGVKIAISAIKQIKSYNIELLLCVTAGIDNVKSSIMSDFGDIPDFVTFLPKTDCISDYYAKCDIFLSSGSIESFCYATREAAYCGDRVVASDIAAHKMDCGEWLYKDKSERSLSETIINCIESDYCSEENRQKVKNKYSLDNWVNETIKLYKRV